MCLLHIYIYMLLKGFFQQHSYEKIFNILCTNLQSIFLPLNLNSIHCIWIKFRNLNSIQVACKWLSIFSFEWNLKLLKFLMVDFWLVIVWNQDSHEDNDNDLNPLLKHPKPLRTILTPLLYDQFTTKPIANFEGLTIVLIDIFGMHK